MAEYHARLAALGLAAFCWSQSALAFECPRPEAVAPRVLQQSGGDDRALAQLFASGPIEDEIGIAVETLQRRYPTVSDAELTNYLIGAYCPVVAQVPNLTDPQRTARVEHFAATLFELLSEQKN